MTVEKLNQIYENLKLHSKQYAVDEIFQMFIDNQLTVIELEALLNKFNYLLPEEFFSLEKADQKKFHQHKKHEIHLINDKETIVTYSIFNKRYFYELVDASSKNKSVTKSLMAYSGELDNLPIHIITMQNVKLKNIDFFMQRKVFVDIIDNKTFLGKKIRTLYDLYFYVLSIPDKPAFSKNKMALLNQLKDFFKNKSGMNLDLDLPFVRFVSFIEMILSSLPRKIANTIKMRFLCYKPDYINDDEYNVSLENGRTLINKHYQSMIKTKIKEVVNYYNKHPEVLNSFNYNGYTAIYYSLLEEVKHG